MNDISIPEVILKPDPNCEFCFGTGTTYDLVDCGSTTVSMPSPCECVTQEDDTIDD